MIGYQRHMRLDVVVGIERDVRLIEVNDDCDKSHFDRILWPLALHMYPWPSSFEASRETVYLPYIRLSRRFVKRKVEIPKKLR